MGHSIDGAAKRLCAALVGTIATFGVCTAQCVDRGSCSDNGDCLNQHCSCDLGYAGDTCNDEIKDDKTDMKLLLQTAILLLLIYVLSSLFRRLRAELLGGIVAGFLLGPVAGWTAHTDAVFTVGRLGLSLLVMEGGLGIDVNRFLKTWKLTTNLALTGTILPCLLGWGLLSAFGYGTLEGFAAGTALSSTSIGMSLMMLIQFDYLKTPLGGIIAVAAMIDDVASLVILSVLGQLQSADADADASDWVWLIFKPILISLALIAAGAILTAMIPGVYARIEAKLRAHTQAKAAAKGASFFEEDGDVSADEKEQMIEKKTQEDLDYLIMVGLLSSTAIMVLSAGYAGSSYLLGAFASGMAFSQLRAKDKPDESRAEALWGQHASLSWWLVSVSFATLGFSIPAADLFEAEGFGLGMLYVIPAILGKLCLGSFVPGTDGGYCTGGFYGNLDDALVVGWAMVARGELGFVMSQESFQADVLSARTYVACIWALFVCTLMPPFVFGWALARKKRKDEEAARMGRNTEDTTVNSSADVPPEVISANEKAPPTACENGGSSQNDEGKGGTSLYADAKLKRFSQI
mmetsp:Transcript_21403/g.55832  ORF Transcript_21403/g.55832 Transcript_21403/m.55832 type:complete len:576 (-) Transcript_21403:817-2544(-)